MLYRGDIYVTPDNAVVTFVRLVDTEAYLNTLIVSPVMREGMLKHYQMLLRLYEEQEMRSILPNFSRY